MAEGTIDLFRQAVRNMLAALQMPDVDDNELHDLTSALVTQVSCGAAMSGWHIRKTVKSTYRSLEKLTAEVRRLCEVIGYNLTPHGNDQCEPGRYHACHAEKQLIAFFINKHLFLPHGMEGNAEIAKLDLNELSDKEYEQLEKGNEHKKELVSCGK
ncbi:unnamed protein product [Sphagnum balticum]